MVTRVVAYLTLFGGLGAIGWVVADILPVSGALEVREIQVLGNDRVARETIVQRARVAPGTRIVEIALDEVALRVRALPWIAEATVRRQMPDRLVIRVEEHQPAMMVQLRQVYLADAKGNLFKQWEPADGETHVVVSGLEAIQGPDMEVVRKRYLQQAWQLAEKVAAGSLGPLHGVHWDPVLGWSLMVGKKGEAMVVDLGANARLGLENTEKMLLVAGQAGITASRIVVGEGGEQIHVLPRPK